jgi:hypothetical protein
VSEPDLFSGDGWESLVDRSERAYATLSIEERVWLNVGFLIIATRRARASRRRRFGRAVPADLDERNEAIDSWADGGAEAVIADAIDEELQPLLRDLELRLEAYLRAAGLHL